MKDKRGFIALMSVILLSAVLLITVSSLSFGGYAGRFDILNTEMKSESASLADGCANIAALKLAEDSGYAGDETLMVGGEPCRVYSVTSGVVHVQVAYRSYYTNLEITVQQSPFAVTGIHEVVSLSP